MDVRFVGTQWHDRTLIPLFFSFYNSISVDYVKHRLNGINTCQSLPTSKLLLDIARRRGQLVHYGVILHLVDVPSIHRSV